MSKKIVIASPYRYRKPRKFYCSGTQQNAVLTPPPPPTSHSPNRHMRSVGEHLLSDPMVMGSNPALGTPSWTEIQFHESTDVMRGKLGCQVAGLQLQPGSSFVELPYRSSIKTMFRVNQTIFDFNNFTKNSELSAA